MFLRHPILSLVTLGYLGFVGWITLGPAPYDDRTAGILARVLELFSRHASTEWITFNLIEFVANIAMFVPVGVFFVLLFGRRQWWLAIVFGVLVSVGIELAQHFWLPTRVADVRDVIANGAGTMIGVIFVELFTWPKAHRLKREREREERFARERDALLARLRAPIAR
ncbi:VanZ family protein [Homoserinimonas sp. OAct 916]|uniref:VanZ family protein n=1 Tax=Homoserinimonas sp. OAct 916 TaxID=2211450 RepID=UPI000DBEA120|nr:VanZ family protein [Homoserinimonas sp. OAct 916]